MRVFLSWSGDKSHAVAQALRDFLPLVINAVDPWVSSEIPKGAHWLTELTKELEDTRMAIICLTREATKSPWLLFEAGVLFKGIGQGRVCPYLLDLAPDDLSGPLSHMQVTRCTRDDTERLLKTLNKALDHGTRTDRQLESAFRIAWPTFEAQLKKVFGQDALATPAVVSGSGRASSGPQFERLDEKLSRPDLDPALRLMLAELRYTDWSKLRWRKVRTLAEKAKISVQQADALFRQVPELVQLGTSQDEERLPLVRLWQQ